MSVFSSVNFFCVHYYCSLFVCFFWVAVFLTTICVVGGFWGDEGKGKMISYLALHDEPSVIARGGVGPNAGHTVVWEGRTYGLRQIPSGFVYDKARLLVGPGVLVNPHVFLDEVEVTNTRNRVGLDFCCGIIEEKHVKEEEESAHLSKKIGSTKTGCGAANAERVRRSLKLARDIPELKEFLVDVPLEVNTAIDEGEDVILEGTQALFLSLFHGTYPYVTSKDTGASALCSDVGVGPLKVDDVIVVFKAYVTRVGGGPLEGELSVEEAEKRGWLERATVTGRVRRSAPFNFDLAKRSVMINSATQIAITKMDIVFPECANVRTIDEFSKEALEFIEKVEKATGIPVTLLGVGPDAEDIVDLREEKL